VMDSLAEIFPELGHQVAAKKVFAEQRLIA
jgi:hypothetical protein